MLNANLKSINFANTPEAKFLLEETEKYLKKEYKRIYDGSMQGLETCPPKYDYGVETKKGHIFQSNIRALIFFCM